MGFLLARARVLQRKVLHLSCLRILLAWPAQPLEGTQNAPVGAFARCLLVHVNAERVRCGFVQLSPGRKVDQVFLTEQITST